MQNLGGSDLASPSRQNSESACRPLLMGYFHQRERPLSDFQNKVLQSCKGCKSWISQPCEWERSHEFTRKRNHPALPRPCTYADILDGIPGPLMSGIASLPKVTDSTGDHRLQPDLVQGGAVIVPSSVNDSSTMRPSAKRICLPFCARRTADIFRLQHLKISPSTQKD